MDRLHYNAVESTSLYNITPLATKVHMILQSFVVLTWMCDTIELVQHVTLWNNTKDMWGQFEFVLPSPTLVWSTPLGLPERCGRCMHQTSHMLTHGTMQGYGLTSLVVCISVILWCKGEKCDNKEWDLNYKDPFPKVLGYYIVCDIMEVASTEFRAL